MLVTVAVLPSVAPAYVAASVALIVTVAVADGAREPRSHDAVPPVNEQVPCVASTETSVRAPASGSETVTPAIVAGP